jgi:hypothetical protein
MPQHDSGRRGATPVRHAALHGMIGGRARPLLSLAASLSVRHRSTRWRVCTGTAVDGMHAVSMTRGLRGLISAQPQALSGSLSLRVRVGGLSPVLSPLAVKTRLKCPSVTGS